MGSHACEGGLGVMLSTDDCEVIRFMPDGNVRDSHVLCLMLTNGLGL